MGTAVQLLTLAVLSAGLRRPAALTTTVAVAAAVVHNFIWHCRWTWHDRPLEGWEILRGFARFVMANGVVSLIGNVTITVVLTSVGWPMVLSNITAIAACGACNFFLADQLVWVTDNR